jgi:hypothetical protein
MSGTYWQTRSYDCRSKYSKAERISDKWAFVFRKTGPIFSKEGRANSMFDVDYPENGQPKGGGVSIVVRTTGAAGVAIETPVIMPSVPSEPMKSCFRS